MLAIYGGVFGVAALIGAFDEEKIKIVEPELESNVLENINDIVYQEVETTFHNYTVTLCNGKVVERGVIHHHECKCKKNGK